jgi:hypothetical protein
VTKKKILYHSDFTLAKTGFGRAAKAIISYLYKTNKYEIVHYCCGIQKSNPELNRTPWKSIGCLPDKKSELEELIKDVSKSKSASYGDLYLDELIKSEKPDIYIGVQDIWGLDFAINSKWFNKINSIIWTTLDSLPLLPDAIEHAKNIKNYWIWSNFATKEFHKLGFAHPITINGPIDDKHFFKLPDEQKSSLRKKFNIDQSTFIIGFVFRNQLRKSVPNLLEGYALWKKENPDVKNSALLLHTSWKEGWNIQKLGKEYGVANSEILTTYICSNCKNYKIQSFCGEKVKCEFCNAKDSMNTSSVNLGVTEEQLNEIYNLMDLYCHPFTSGGQEIPIQEAKLTELITLVTNYSCGEEMCEDVNGTIPLEWHEYREHGTEFKKASTDAKSIKNNINKVYRMKKNERIKLGGLSRKWALEKFSISCIGPKIEKLLDSLPPISFDFSFELNNFLLKIKNEKKIFDTKNKKNLLILNIDNDLDIIYALSIPEKIQQIYKQSDLYLAIDHKYINLFADKIPMENIVAKNEIYNDVDFLRELKLEYKFDNIFKLNNYSSKDNSLLKLNKTNIDIII